MTQQRVKKYVGGQAVIEGVMMRGPKIMATACRNQMEPSRLKKNLRNLSKTSIPY